MAGYFVLPQAVPAKVIKVSPCDADSYHYEVEAGGRAVGIATQKHVAACDLIG
jgi:hypothetical protein